MSEEANVSVTFNLASFIRVPSPVDRDDYRDAYTANNSTTTTTTTTGTTTTDIRLHEACCPSDDDEDEDSSDYDDDSSEDSASDASDSDGEDSMGPFAGIIQTGNSSCRVSPGSSTSTSTSSSNSSSSSCSSSTTPLPCHRRGSSASRPRYLYTLLEEAEETDPMCSQYPSLATSISPVTSISPSTSMYGRFTSNRCLLSR